MQSPEKPTRLGTVSFILAIIIAVLWCIYFILFAAMTEGGLTFGTDSETAGYAIVLGGGTVMVVLTVLLTLAGIILGIMALRKQDPKRGLAIAGLVLNFLCFAPYCLFFLLIMLGGLSAMDFSKFIPSFAP
jgi:bacteriorhodopsin